ncbi:MAG: hypothetical protein QOK43_310 [Acidimicrobiaceae bacterium]|nr:hypothetical protein [Acidimicrobiaceae bacterium]MDQ1443655.1 hypothetical protein [Acidimicrobiaceae bacterium]
MLFGAGGVVGGAHAKLGPAGCRTTAYWPTQPDPIPPAPPPPPLPIPPRPALGHGGAAFVAYDEGDPVHCVYTPDALQQNFAVTSAGPWRILARNPAGAERVLVAGGPVSSTSRPYAGTFSVLPGDRVVLEVDAVCGNQNIPTVTIPGTGKGVEGGDVCETVGAVFAGG